MRRRFIDCDRGPDSFIERRLSKATQDEQLERHLGHPHGNRSHSRPDFDCPIVPKPTEFIPTESPAPGTFQALVQLLDASSRSLIGPAQPRLLVIPLRGDDGTLAGGFWGATMFEWLHVGLLFVPEALRSQGVGSALMASAED